jgi:hypothetical protein
VSKTPPIPFRFVDGAFVPVGDKASRAAAFHYDNGHIFWLVPHLDSDPISMRHQFAWLHTAYANLPEHYAGQFASAEHLRKTALIQTGFCTVKDIVCQTVDAAVQLAAWAQSKDEYCVVMVEGTVVRIFEPESQSRKAMGLDRFEASKAAILNHIAGLIGTTPKALERAAKENRA